MSLPEMRLPFRLDRLGPARLGLTLRGPVSVGPVLVGPVLICCALFGALAAPARAGDISLYAGNPGPATAPDAQRAGEVVLNAMTLAGLRYAYGSQSVTQGMDCSALVQHVYRESAQQELPRTSEEQSRVGELVLRRELLAGDLVFFNTSGQPFSHVGIYVGEGRFVHAPSTGGKIRLESMDKAYWAARYNGARRVADSASLARLAAR